MWQTSEHQFPALEQGQPPAHGLESHLHLEAIKSETLEEVNQA